MLVEYTDRMVYPGGNSINPSGGRPTVIPLVSESGTGADRQLAISAFLDPKYWRRVYLCDAARESSPEARRGRGGGAAAWGGGGGGGVGVSTPRSRNQGLRIHNTY